MTSFEYIPLFFFCQRDKLFILYVHIYLYFSIFFAAKWGWKENTAACWKGVWGKNTWKTAQFVWKRAGNEGCESGEGHNGRWIRGQGKVEPEEERIGESQEEAQKHVL